MNKRLNILLTALCAVLLGATSCRQIDEGAFRLADVTILARTAPQTRTQISQSQEAGFLDILWSPNDSIGVFGSGISNALFTNSSAEASNESQFNGKVAVDGEIEYAYSPYNKGAADVSAIPMTIAPVQTYTDPTSIGANDIKASNSPESTPEGMTFTFESKAAMLKIVLDATQYEGLSQAEVLRSITIKAPDGRLVTGNYTLDLVNLTLTAGSTTESTIQINTGTDFKIKLDTATVYAVIYPGIRKSDALEFEVLTSSHRFSFRKKASKDFQPGAFYTMTLDLKKTSTSSGFKDEELSTLPHFTKFAFKASANSGAILDKEVYYDGLSCSTKVKDSDGVSMSIDDDGNVSGCIPYLYNFKLIPEFTLSDTDSRYEVRVGDAPQTSGKSVQDFSSQVIYTIYDSTTGASKDYTADISNTGLPVIVLTQNTAGTYYNEGWNWYLDRYLVSKTSDFGTTDRIAIYEGKGEVSLEEMDCGFRQRGNFSMRFPKKAVNIKLSEKKKILGMSKHKRWCLLSNWNDRTLLRNDLSFEIARRIAASSAEGTGFDWQPSGRFVELVLNEMHVGTYYICEQIRQDNKRVNINDGYDDRIADYNSGKSTEAPSYSNCGYLLEMDNNSSDYSSAYGYEEWSFSTSYCYQRSNSHIPVVSHNDYDYTTLGQSIWKQLKSYVNNADYNIYYGNYSTASDYVDMTSASDYMLMMELAMNHEYMHPKSVYLHKDGAGKLYFGPVWDFDVWTYPNIPNISNMGRQNETFPNSYSKWTFQTESTSSHYYIWYRHLLKQQSFINLVKERWSAIGASADLTPEAVGAYLDSLASQIRTSMEYNDSMWPRTYTSPVSGYQNGDEWKSDSNHTPYTFEESVELLKATYRSRYNNMSTMVNALSTYTYPN